MTQKTSRRRFIQFGAAGIGMFVTDYGGLFRPAQAAAAMRSRYLINIQSFGGQDSAWTYSTMRQADTAGLNSEQLKMFFGAFPTPRFPDSLMKPMGTGYLGMSMRAFTAAQLGRMAVIRGMDAEGSHDVGNRMIQDGHLSGYAASFSTIVADALAKSPDKLRDLHYVQITGNSADFRSQVGFFHGPGLPLNVADSGTWDRLSATDANNPFKTAAQQAAIDAAITGLANDTGAGLKARSSQDLFRFDFLNAYDASNSIMGKNFSLDPKFIATANRYQAAVLADMTALIFGTDTKLHALNALKYHPSFANPTAAGLEASLLSNFGVGSLKALLFPYILADYLVSEDLSAVVDVPALGGDYHDLNDKDFLASAVNMACLRCLMTQLATKQVPEGGAYLLDKTLVVYSTEFDRQIARTPLLPTNLTRPGTDHGPTSSAILAGYRIKGNKIVGGRGTGPQGQFGGVLTPFIGPLPVNANGDPDAAGELMSQRSLLPTILAIFGLSVPAQQKTELEAITAVITGKV